MTQSPIVQLWQRIHDFAEAHAPAMCADLAGPASAQDLAALRALELPIPESLFESLSVHDGERGESWGMVLAGGGRLLSARDILAHRKMLREVQASLAASMAFSGFSLPEGVGIGPVRGVSTSEQWLAIADLNGDYVWYLDFDPLPGGDSGQVIRVAPESGEWLVCAASYHEFLCRYVEALEAGQFEIVNGELQSEQPWPGIADVPAFAPGSFNREHLLQLGAADRWDVALELADRLEPPLQPEERLRLEARASLRQGDAEATLAKLDELRAAGFEQEDDLWLRIDVLEAERQMSDVLAELGFAISRFNSARFWHRRAGMHRELAAEPPFKASRSKAMDWLASPAGQQHFATAYERAVADYEAALAREERPDWRLDLGEALLEAARWEDAERALGNVIVSLQSGDGDLANNESLLERAREGLESARGRGERSGENMLGSFDELLAELGDQAGGSAALKEVSALRDQFARLLEAEIEEKVQRAASPERLDVEAMNVAAQLAARHRDVPERYAPFDPPLTDAQALRYYERAQLALEAIGYRHLADVEPLRNTEISGARVLVRLMTSADSRIVAALWRVGNVYTTIEAIDLESWLENGSVLLTNNTGSANPFEAPAGIEQESLPQGTDAKRLDEAHRRRLGARPTRALLDLEAVTALQEAQRLLKREHARREGWVSESELRGLLGASHAELAPRVRARLQQMLE